MASRRSPRGKIATSFLLFAGISACLFDAPAVAGPPAQSVGIASNQIDAAVELAEKRRQACGPISVWYCLRLLEYDASLEDLIRQAPVSGQGMKLNDILELFQSRDVPAKAWHVNRTELRWLATPAILILGNHCVVLCRVDPEKRAVTVFDPASFEIVQQPCDVLLREWSGDVILLRPPPRSLALILVGIVAGIVGTALMCWRGRRLWAAQHRLACWGSCLAIASCGCSGSAAQNSQSGMTATSSLERRDEDPVTFNAGRVLAGEIVQHTFEFNNELKGRVRIASDDGIRKDCGCTKIEVAPQLLEAGAKAQITLSVNTAGRNGPQHQGGAVIWTEDSGRQRTQLYSVQMQVEPAITARPPSLRFDEDDVAQLAEKDVTFDSALPLDWGSVELVSSSPLVTILKSHSDRDSLRCRVRVAAAPDRRDLSATILAKGKMRSPGASRAVIDVVCGVPIRVEFPFDLHVSPQTPTLVVDAAGRGVARFVLEGKRIEAGGQCLRRVSMTGADADLSIRPVGTNGLLVEVTVTSISADIQKRPRARVEAHFSDGKDPLTIELFVLRTPSREHSD